MVHINDAVTQVGAHVNAERQIVTRSIIETELEHASVNGRAYSWDSLEVDIAANETMLYVRNDSDTPLILDRVIFNGSDAICTWTVLLGTADTTPTGTIVVGVNQNTTFTANLAEATAFHDETAVADGSIIARIKTIISGHHVHTMNGVILGKNHYVQINQITESDSGSVTLIGHYENPD